MWKVSARLILWKALNMESSAADLLQVSRKFDSQVQRRRTPAWLKKPGERPFYYDEEGNIYTPPPGPSRPTATDPSGLEGTQGISLSLAAAMKRERDRSYSQQLFESAVSIKAPLSVNFVWYLARWEADLARTSRNGICPPGRM